MDTITLVTVVKNEEKYLKKFLSSLTWVNEIIIVDNASTDASVAIAKQYTTHVFINKIQNLGKLKQFALSKATKDWILLLDVDEFVDTTLQAEIQKMLRERTDADGFKLTYINHFMQKPLSSETYAKVRLFRSGKGSVAANHVHEEVVISGNIQNMKGHILHYSYRSPFHVLQKFTRYAYKELPELISQKETVTLKKLTLYPLNMIRVRIFTDRAYQDGWRGILLAVLFGYYEFARYFLLLLVYRKLIAVPKDTL